MITFNFKVLCREGLYYNTNWWLTEVRQVVPLSLHDTEPLHLDKHCSYTHENVSIHFFYDFLTLYNTHY